MSEIQDKAYELAKAAVEQEAADGKLLEACRYELTNLYAKRTCCSRPFPASCMDCEQSVVLLQRLDDRLRL